MNNFHPFVLPFTIGTIILFVILIALFVKWLLKMDKSQQIIALKNIISFKTIKAIWEAIRECLFHRNIFRTNPVLGYMHLSFAFGWFLFFLNKTHTLPDGGKSAPVSLQSAPVFPLPAALIFAHSKDAG